jgi:hypothetical protein
MQEASTACLRRRIVFTHTAEPEESDMVVEITGWEEEHPEGRVGITLDLLTRTGQLLSSTTTTHRNWDLEEEA